MYVCVLNSVVDSDRMDPQSALILVGGSGSGFRVSKNDHKKEKCEELCVLKCCVFSLGAGGFSCIGWSLK
jgi:hypothetical protein